MSSTVLAPSRSWQLNHLVQHHPQPTDSLAKRKAMAAPPPPTLRRRLVIADGSELDLNGSIPVTPEVVTAMRARIFELEDMLSGGEEARPAKRARVSSAETESGGSNPAAAAAMDEKKHKIQVKKILDHLKKECKGDVKFQGSPKTIKFDEILEYAEFQRLFAGKGALIQPTPTNKPTSTVTIMRFTGAEVEEFFGGEISGLKGNAWTRGGGPAFSRSVNLGQCGLRVNSLDLNYSKNGMKCTFKFEVVALSGMAGCYGPSGKARGGWFC